MSQIKKKLRNKIARNLGEHAVIDLMRTFFEPMPNTPVPFGDDVSAVPLDEGDVAVLKADMLVAKTDVPCGMSLRQAAEKAVVMNISDFAAKGVKPQAVMVSLGLPRNLMRKDLEEIAKGLNSASRENGAYVVGGDTGEACDLIISIHLFGTAKKDDLMLRSGAKAGDILAVTGFFGKPAAGLQLLLHDSRKASNSIRDVLVDAVCNPKARLNEGLALARSGAVTASIDSSDGLAWCLHELSVKSGVGFLVSSLPVADEVLRFAKANGLDADEYTLYGGEEYELLVTINPKLWAKAENALESVGGRLLPIGKATHGKKILLDIAGKKRAIEPRGYEHFKS